MNRHRNDNQGTQALCDEPPVARAKATTPASPLRYYGGLQSFARKLVARLPPHDFYIEPFAGGLSVLLSKPVSDTEIVSDVNADLINYWRVVQRPRSRRRLLELVEMTPYSRALFNECIGVLENGSSDSLLRALAMAVAQNQSRNGLGVDWSYAKRVSNMNANSWAKLPARMELAGRRLRHVRIECKPYQEILREFDTPRTVVFLDPPYLPSTRVSAKVYLHEFGRAEHARLLGIVCKMKAKVMLCGYRDELIDDTLDGWRRTDIKAKSFAAPRAKGCKLAERVLSLWTNFVPRSVQ